MYELWSGHSPDNPEPQERKFCDRFMTIEDACASRPPDIRGYIFLRTDIAMRLDGGFDVLHVMKRPRGLFCLTDCGDGSTIYDDRPRPGA